MLRWFVRLACVLSAAFAANKYLDVCVDGTMQKSKPGAVDGLFGQCSLWKERGCCTVLVSQLAHNGLYYFNWDHCGVMSQQCKKHFIQNFCLYECSPNLGPWIQPAGVIWREEKPVDVPLCKEDCDNWFDDCRMDYTCMSNFLEQWNWTTGVNQCPSGSECRTFEEIFQTSENFCENVWNNSYKYTTHAKDSGLCMQLWFTSENGNPNDKVAEYYANLMDPDNQVKPRDCDAESHNPAEL